MDEKDKLLGDELDSDETEDELSEFETVTTFKADVKTATVLPAPNLGREEVKRYFEHRYHVVPAEFVHPVTPHDIPEGLEEKIDNLIQEVQKEKEQSLSTEGRAAPILIDVLCREMCCAGAGGISGLARTMATGEPSVGAGIWYGLSLGAVISLGVLGACSGLRATISYYNRKLSEGKIDRNTIKYFGAKACQSSYYIGNIPDIAARIEVFDNIISCPKTFKPSKPTIGQYLSTATRMAGYGALAGLFHIAGYDAPLAVQASLAILAPIFTSATDCLIKEGEHIETFERYNPIVGNLNPDQRKALVRHLVRRMNDSYQQPEDGIVGPSYTPRQERDIPPQVQVFEGTKTVH